MVACTAGREPNAPAIALTASLNNGEGVVVQAMGAGVVDFNPTGEFGDGKFQFVAIRRADGSVTGHFYQSRERATASSSFMATSRALRSTRTSLAVRASEGS
jgi:hypothetical protein